MRRASGFTLVEVVLATTISALVLAGAYASLATILSAYRIQEGQYANTDKARLILSRMREDLAAAFLSPHQAMTRFVGTDNQNGTFSTDTLTFISTVNNSAHTGGGTSDLAEIQYYIDMDDSTEEKWLVRRFDATPDMDPFSGGELALLGPQALSLNFEYFDGAAWWPTWDSAEEIPIAVNVTVGIFEPKQLGEEPNETNVTHYSKLIWLAQYREISAGQLSGEPGSTAESSAEASSTSTESIPSSGGGRTSGR